MLNLTTDIFQQPCTFKIAATHQSQIPELGLPEVAFIGRSNVGKSSLLNKVTNRKKLARTSQSPGCTRQINFFSVAERLIIVDLPGYGYAQVSKKMIAEWRRLINGYLLHRVALRRIFMLVDARHGLKVNDLEMLDFLKNCAVVVQVVLTKIDKISSAQLTNTSQQIMQQINSYPMCYPELLTTSSKSIVGVHALQQAILEACS